MTEQTARERFVEAISHIDDRHGHTRSETSSNCLHCADIREAVEAFADAECPLEHDDMGPHDHAACRAALLKECGL